MSRNRSANITHKAAATRTDDGEVIDLERRVVAQAAERIVRERREVNDRVDAF